LVVSITKRVSSRASRAVHATPTVTTEKTSRHGHHYGSRGPLVMNMSTRPSFGQWLKVTWLDLVTMVIMGIIGLRLSLQCFSIPHTFLALTIPPRSTKPTQIPPAPSPSTFKTAKSSTPNSPTPCATKSSPSGSPPSSSHRRLSHLPNPHPLLLGHGQRSHRPPPLAH